jgi:hypothetical protein
MERRQYRHQRPSRHNKFRLLQRFRSQSQKARVSIRRRYRGQNEHRWAWHGYSVRELPIKSVIFVSPHVRKISSIHGHTIFPLDPFTRVGGPDPKSIQDLNTTVYVGLLRFCELVIPGQFKGRNLDVIRRGICRIPSLPVPEKPTHTIGEGEIDMDSKKIVRSLFIADCTDVVSLRTS